SLLGPLFLESARRLAATDPELSFLLPAAGAERLAQLQALLADFPGLPLTLVEGRSREVMAAADAVLLASGTATLESLLLKRPMVVAYRMAPLSWALVSRLVKTPFAALPNILAGRSLVPELIQGAATAEAVVAAVQPLLRDDQAVRVQVQAFEAIHRSLALGFAERCADAVETILADRAA
ncbi:MAG TPA: lipid-A-disaccharide synthase, partial [Kineobactrum sp.]